MSVIHITVAKLKTGDTFAHEGRAVWEAIGDAQLDARGAVHVKVVYAADGGRSERIWDDPATAIKVQR